MLGVLFLRPWIRGPLLLLRRPGVALAVAAAALVATLPAAAAAPFLSSARSATLHRQIDRTCQWELGVRISSRVTFAPQAAAGGPDQTSRPTPRPGRTDLDPAVLDGRRAVERAAAARVDGLGPTVETLFGYLLARTTTRPEVPAPLAVMARDGFAEHVEIRQGPVGPGIWLSHEYAEANRLTVGDTIALTEINPDAVRRYDASGERLIQAPTPVRVAAIYTDLRRTPDTPYWCSFRDVYRGPPGTELDDPPPHLALLDRDTFRTAANAQYLEGTQVFEHLIPGVDRFTQPRTERLSDEIAVMRGELLSPDSSVFRADYVHATRFGSLLAHQSDRAEYVRRNLLPPVVPITVAGVLVGLIVVAASGIFWTVRRRRELTALAAHGVGAAALGIKAVAESFPVLLVGAGAGWAAAWALVRGVGPSPMISAEALPLSLIAAGGTFLLSVLVVGVAAGIRCRALTDQLAPRRRRPRLGRVPWELLLAGGAIAAWRLMDGSTEAVSSGAGAALGAVARVPARLLVVPIIVATAVTILAARLGTSAFRRWALARAPKRPGTLLAWRRLGREATTAATLAGAVAVPIALAAYGATVNDSVHATLDAEARVIIGADVVLTLSERTAVPASLNGRATEVLRVNGTLIDGIQTDVLAVDPATFGRDAFWDDRLSRRSMAEMLGDLRPPARQDQAIAAFGSGVAPEGNQVATLLGKPLLTVDVTNVGRLPAKRSSYPQLLIHRDALDSRAVAAASPQLWVRGDPVEIAHLAREAGLPLVGVAVADTIFRDTVFEPLTYTFSYLSALSLMTGLVTTVGLLMYLEGRAPAHRRAYVMLRRMGLRRRTHLRVLLAELSLPLVAGLVGGLAVAGVIATQLASEFEINGDLPPDTVLVLPIRTVAVIAAAVAVIALVSAGYADQRVSRARPGEVLRDAR